LYAPLSVAALSGRYTLV